MARKGKLSIKKELCKGCNICVRFCPRGVLVLNEFKVEVADESKCTACMMCELRCPDFAIGVEIEEAI